ncbi:CobW family GTP-binding protein [Falsirhodobacter sp. 20TX0035]|uniref:CobW family GTP-binding protein n=1 Tax=Falsirhodobacter sp. 20TX0035 TaxID=3022019 RepID=UPI00232A82F5|nr:GTP-binding protein [Falsirhodobacter sp. 20TX0035]MDB6454233.1 GTP-binding protein [Falsirhodobacter sp. 20TX0035]
MIPVTILNGFLGAGKTTLMQSLLGQARRRPDVRLGVIVNEMSELDVDGAILDLSEAISRKDARFATIPAGSISGPAGLAEFAAAVDRIVGAGATHVLIETSGSTHPWPLIQAAEGHPMLRLHGFLSVVDTVTLAQDHDMGRAILPQAQAGLAEGKRGIANLLAEQIMFASRILLSKMDRVGARTLREVAEAIHPLNRQADIMGMQWGNVRLDHVLAMPPYDHSRVALLGAELADWDRSYRASSMSGPEAYRLTGTVLSDPRPFHPRRLHDTYTRELDASIHRSKGFFWLPSRDTLQLLWNQTAGSIRLEIINYWKISALEDESLNLMPAERRAMENRLHDMSPIFGDRRCRLTIIGEGDGPERFAARLKECFCTEEEIMAWKAGKPFDDPWPATNAVLAG